MAYTPLTTAAQIESYFTGVSFSDAGAAVTTAEVDNWIAQATSIIYGSISQKYVIPVTDADDLKQLESLADMFVLTNVKQTLNPQQLKTVKDSFLKIIKPDHNGFYSILKMYESSELLLNNTENSTVSLQAKSYNNDNDIEPEAEKGVDQW